MSSVGLEAVTAPSFARRHDDTTLPICGASGCVEAPTEPSLPNVGHRLQLAGDAQALRAVLGSKPCQSQRALERALGQLVPQTRLRQALRRAENEGWIVVDRRSAGFRYQLAEQVVVAHVLLGHLEVAIGVVGELLEAGAELTAAARAQSEGFLRSLPRQGSQLVALAGGCDR